MTGWLLYDRPRAKGSAFLIERYFKACAADGAALDLIFAEDIFPCVSGGRPGVTSVSGGALALPDFVVCRTAAPALSRHLELCGTQVFNSSAAALLCNDKPRSYAAAAAAGARVLDCVFAGSEELPADLSFPLVLKPARGSGGKGVIMAKSRDEALRHMRASGGDWVLQRPAPVLGRDLRVYMLGGRAVCAVLRESDTDFRANLSFGGRARVYGLSDAERASVESLCAGFDFSLIGADFLFGGDGGLIFNEFEDVVGARALYKLTDIDIAAEYVGYIIDALSRGQE